MAKRLGAGTRKSGPLGQGSEYLCCGCFSRSSKPVFFAISSGQAGTAIYADGTLVRRVPDFKLTSQDLSGQFVIGNGPLTTYNWSGQMKGLAIYDRELSATEVSQNYANWTVAGQ